MMNGREGAAKKHWCGQDMVGKTIMNLSLAGISKIADQCTGIF
jgi:hypothetical protein